MSPSVSFSTHRAAHLLPTSGLSWPRIILLLAGCPALLVSPWRPHCMSTCVEGVYCSTHDKACYRAFRPSPCDHGSAASSASAADTTATAASPSSGFLALAYDNQMKPDGAAAQMIRMLGIYGITKEVSA